MLRPYAVSKRTINIADKILEVNWSLLLHGRFVLSLFGVLWRVVGTLRRTRPATQAG